MARPKGEAKLGGRQKGTPNKLTKSVKDMILGALEDVGGQEYFVRQSSANPAAFMSLIKHITPQELPKSDIKTNEHVAKVVRFEVVE